MKLVEIKNPNTITPVQMKDGQIGVIRGWTAHNKEFVGRIVQRYGELFITLGMPVKDSWGNIHDLDRPECQVEILPAGTILEV